MYLWYLNAVVNVLHVFVPWIRRVHFLPTKDVEGIFAHLLVTYSS